MHRPPALLRVVTAFALLGLACSSEPTSTTDAGVSDASTPDVAVDAGAPDAGSGTDTGTVVDAGASCAGARTVTLRLGAPMRFEGNTTGRASGLTLGCGLGGSPQEVVSLRIPGNASTRYGLDASLFPTGADFDTVLEFRVACDRATDAVCNDDLMPGDRRSTIRALGIPGGSTVTLIATGHGPTDFGAWSIDASAFEMP